LLTTDKDFDRLQGKFIERIWIDPKYRQLEAKRSASARIVDNGWEFGRLRESGLSQTATLA
jgi:hypothetical protein